MTHPGTEGLAISHHSAECRAQIEEMGLDPGYCNGSGCTFEITPAGREVLAGWGALKDETDEEKRARREKRLLGPSAEEIRDMEVARATVRPKSECPHCNPSGDHR